MTTKTIDIAATFKIEEHFKQYAVKDVSTVEQFLKQYYKAERYTGRGSEYAAVLLASYKEDLANNGFVLISHHDSVTGKCVSFYGPVA